MCQSRLSSIIISLMSLDVRNYYYHRFSSVAKISTDYGPVTLSVAQASETWDTNILIV